MIIEGLSLSQRLLEGKLLRGGKYTSSHDHRMVMALTVAAQGADSDIEIDDSACVAKSCPQFFDLFRSCFEMIPEVDYVDFSRQFRL